MKQFLRHIFLLVAMFLATANAWADDCTYEYDRKVYNTSIKASGDVIAQYEFTNVYGLSSISYKLTLQCSAAGKDLQYKVQYLPSNSSTWTDANISTSTLDGTWQAWQSESSESKTEAISSSSPIFNARGVRIVSNTKFGSKRTVSVDDVKFVMAKTLSGSEETMPFDDQVYNTTSSAKTRVFTFSNVATGKSISITNNTNATEFPAEIDKNGDCTGSVTVSVSFKPSQKGTRTGQITISGDCGSKTFSVTGNGLLATPTLTLKRTTDLVDRTTDVTKPNHIDLGVLFDTYIGDGYKYEVVSSNSQYAHFEGDNFYATEKGEYTIHITSPAGDHYSDTFADGKKYREIVITVRDKARPVYSANYTQSLADGMFVDGIIENAFTLTNVSKDAYFACNILETSISNINDGSGKVISYDIINNKIVAHNAGTATLQFVQTENNDYYGEESPKYTFTVSKHQTSFGGEAYSMMVEGTQIANYSYTNTSAAQPTASNSDSFYYTIDEVNFANEELNKGTDLITFNPSAKQITAWNAGTAKITFHQKETYKYIGATASYNVTVNKHTPVFTLNPEVSSSPEKLYFNKEYPNYFTTTANSPLTLTSSDTLVAKWVQGSNPQSYTLKTFSKTNTATLTAIQHENYFWERLEGSIDIQLQDPNNHVPFTIDTQEKRDLFDVFSNASPYTWDNGIQMGNWEDGGSWDDKYVDLHFTGVPNKLGFSTSVKEAGIFPASDIYWYVKESEDGVNWSSEIWNNEGTKNITITDSILLNPKTRYVRLCYSGNFGCVFHNVTVSKREEFYASEVDTKNKIDTLNFDIDPNGDPKENQVGIPHSLSFDFHYANVGHDVKLSTNDPDHFTLSQTNFKNIGGEKVGKETITVTYLASEKYTAENKELYITDELGNKYTIALTASTVKATQTLTWQGVYAAEKPVVRISEGAISNLAIASSDLQVTYRSSDESIVKVSEDSLSLIPLQMADAVEITAIQKGNNVWNEVKETKTFRITDKLTQLILWPNTLSDLVIGGDNIALDAKVYVVNDETGEYTFSESLTSNLHYEVENTNVVAIEEGVLKIKGIGETYLTVTAPGNTEYAESSIRVYVRVRAEATGCEDYLLNSYYTNEELRYFQMNLNAIQYDFEIDRTNGEPGHLTLQHRGVAWAANYKAEFVVYYSTITSNELKELGSFYPKKNESGVAEFELPRDANKFYIKRLYGGQGYQYLSNIQVHPAQYVETNVSEIDFGNIYVGSQVTQTFTVNYCNIKSELYTQTSSNDVHVSPSSFGGCNAYDSQSVTVSWTPSSIHDNEQTVTITDPVSGKSASVRIFANVLKGTQTLDWDAPAQIDACGQLVLPKETDEHIALDWSLVEGQQYADFEDGMLAIKGNGTITLRASNNGSENYNVFQKDYQIKVVYNPIFLGTEDKDWNNPSNWSVCNLPSETDVVTVQASAVLEEAVTVGGLIFHEGGSMQILSNGGLTVGARGITGAKEDGSTITIDNTPEGAGFLKVDPSTDNKPAKVTVNYTTKAYNSGNPRDEIWQYMGAPGSDMQMSDANNTMIYHWNEQQGWLKMSNTNLQPFVGYAFTQNKADSASFQIQATPIIPNDVQEIELTVTPTGMGGSNLFVNSFLAPIDLAKFDTTEFVGKVDQTFYLFNSGSWKDWQSQGGKDHMEKGTSPGQYFALTPGSAALVDASLDQTTIPSMQGVYVIAREDGAKIKLDYAKHVYAADASNQPMRAPERISEDFKRIRLHVNSQNSGADRMYVIQHEAGTAGYDNGYDARNMAVNGQVAIYTHELDGQMEISVSDKIDSTYIGFRAGSDSEYTLRMTSVVGEEMYLKDLVDNILIPVVDGQDYTFSATPNSVNDNRFLLLGQKSGVATDIEEVHVYIHDNMVHVMEAPENSSMSIYTVGGVTVANYSIGYAPCTIDLLGLPTGVYVLRINDKAYKFVCK